MPRVTANLTVGLEIECVRMSNTTDFEIGTREFGFSRHLDHSIRGDNNEVLPRTWPGAGTEIVTRPITVPVVMNGDGNALRLNTFSLDDATRRLCASVGHVNSSCGFHIHLGRPSKADPAKSSWEPDRVRTMLVIGQILEQRLLSLVHPSRVNNHHCMRIGQRYSKADLAQFYPVGRVDPIKYNNQKRYCWLNLIEAARVGNRTEPGLGGSPALGTIEVRLLGDTADTNYILSWTTLWTKIAALVAYSPASLAISHCCFSNTLERDFLALKAAFEADSKNKASVVGSEQASPVRGADDEVQTTMTSTPIISRPRAVPTTRVRRRNESISTATTSYTVPTSTSTSNTVLPALPYIPVITEDTPVEYTPAPPTTPF